MTAMNKLPLATSLAALFCLASLANAAELKVPSTVVAGNPITVTTSGNGEATLYVFGPGTAIKRKIQLGQDFR